MYDVRAQCDHSVRVHLPPVTPRPVTPLVTPGCTHLEAVRVDGVGGGGGGAHVLFEALELLPGVEQLLRHAAQLAPQLRHFQ